MEQNDQTPVATISFSEEQFFSALAKVIAPIADGIVAILKKQDAIIKRIDADHLK
jgi:hypothetical protein